MKSIRKKGLYYSSEACNGSGMKTPRKSKDPNCECTDTTLVDEKFGENCLN